MDSLETEPGGEVVVEFDGEDRVLVPCCFVLDVVGVSGGDGAPGMGEFGGVAGEVVVPDVGSWGI